MTQGALFSMCNAANHALRDTNVRFNELYLALRVEFDSVAETNKTVKSSDFARAYEKILSESNLKSCRVRVDRLEDLAEPKVEQK